LEGSEDKETKAVVSAGKKESFGNGKSHPCYEAAKNSAELCPYRRTLQKTKCKCDEKLAELSEELGA
jgi:hypothetical protein